MSGPLTRFQFTADKGDARLRLDQALVRHLGREMRLSRAMAQRWIDEGRVVVDGSPARRASHHVLEGRAVEVSVPASAPRKVAPAPEEASIDILFEDAHLIAINKPPGVVVHPTYKHTSHTLINAVLWHVRHRPDARPGALTRLDKDTSGIVLIALAPAVHGGVQAAMRGGGVLKEYLAVVHGSPTPPHGTVTLALGRDDRDRRRVVARADGAPSATRYTVETTGGGHAVVRCQLITGRTHQVRVHMSASGWPLVGDRVYGTANGAIGRQALHAWRLSLTHPVTGAPLHLEAPPPPDMQRVLADAGWGQNDTL
jgi:23S rRNA pseudouridine1911/1915/1917 synthase